MIDPSGSMVPARKKVSGMELVQQFADSGETDVESVITALGLGDTGVDTVVDAVVFMTDGEIVKGSNHLTEIYS